MNASELLQRGALRQPFDDEGIDLEPLLRSPVSARATAYAYAPANLAIEEVIFDPAQPRPGDEVSVSVRVRETSSGSDWVAGFVVVQSPQLSAPVVYYCSVIEQGTTEVFDGSCSACGATSSFQMPSGGLDLDAVAGGHVSGNHCSTQLRNGTRTDQRTVTLEPVTFDPNAVDIIACPTLHPTTVSRGDEVSISVQVHNTGDVPVTFDIRILWTSSSTGEELVLDVLDDVPLLPLGPDRILSLSDRFTVPSLSALDGAGDVAVELINVAEG